MDRGAGAFPRRVEARDYRLGISPLRHNDLAEIVGRDAAHHVMHCRHHGDGVLHRIDIGEFLRDLADARQPLVDHFGPEMVQLQQQVVSVRAGAPPFLDFGRHGARDYVARG